VQTIALPSLLRSTAVHHITFTPPHVPAIQHSLGTPCTVERSRIFRTIHHNVKIGENFRSKRFLCRQIGPTWDRPCRPILEIEPDRLLIATGQCLKLHDLAHGDRPDDSRKGAVSVHSVPVPIVRQFNSRVNREGWGRFTPRDNRPSPLDDLTGVIALGQDEYVISTVGGRLQRIALQTRQYHELQPVHAVSKALYQHPVNTPIESLVSSKSGHRGGSISHFLTASHDGLISLYNAPAPWTPPISFKVGTRPWSSHLRLEGSKPYVAVGTSGLEPLNLYQLDEGGAFYGSGNPQTRKVTPSHTLMGAQRKSAVYDVVSPENEMALPFSGDSSAFLLSAWFDGKARIHDLRVSGGGILTSGTDSWDSMRRRPVLEAYDPWVQSSLYSCAWVGQGNIATGSSRHGMVSFYDTRMMGMTPHVSLPEMDASGIASSGSNGDSALDPLAKYRGGYSIYTPGRPESPVYSLKGEGGRLWGVTDRRAFVAAFDIEGRRPDTRNARGWDVVGRACQVPSGGSRTYHRRGHREIVDDVKDHAVGYAMGDRELKMFESLRGY
jgi:hypothetical protein